MDAFRYRASIARTLCAWRRCPGCCVKPTELLGDPDGRKPSMKTLLLCCCEATSTPVRAGDGVRTAVFPAAPTTHARRSSATALRRARGWPAPHRPLSSVSSGRIRPGSLSKTRAFLTSDWFMDTQRLILFVIFLSRRSSCWERWQSSIGRRLRRRTVASSAAPAPSGAATTVHRTGAVPPALARRGAGGPPPRLRAPSEKGRRQDRSVHRDGRHPWRGSDARSLSPRTATPTTISKPYVLLQKNAERTFIAQSGLLGEGFPNHRTLWQAAARAARAWPPARTSSVLKLQATRRPTATKSSRS